MFDKIMNRCSVVALWLIAFKAILDAVLSLIRTELNTPQTISAVLIIVLFGIALGALCTRKEP